MRPCLRAVQTMIDSADDGNILVNVRAQVMTRDDTTGGWVPFKGGGLINVSVIRRPTVLTNLIQDSSNHKNSVSSSSPSSGKKLPYEYIIYGRRTVDNHEILNCSIEKNFVYNKVMPTFHHWRAGECKYGLTFQTAADARAFDRGVRMAYEELFDGFAAENLLADEKRKTGSEDEIFMSLNLPGEPPEPPRPSPVSVLTSVTTTTATPTDVTSIRNLSLISKNHFQCTDHLDIHKAPIHYNNNPNNGPSIIKIPPPHPLQSADLASDNYPYVQLTSLNHEYLYPVIEEQQQQQRVGKVNRTNSTGSLKKPDIIVSQPTKAVDGLAVKSGRENLRLQCKHCQELYSEEDNRRGACEYAPDSVKNGIAKVSCLTCAQCMLYHCMSDAEGDFAQNPCNCSTEEGCGRRWFGLAMLSIIVPCLWFYPPLRALHWCGVTCGICGARHRAAD